MFRYGTWRLVIQFLSFLFFSAIIFNLGVLSLLLPVMWTWALPQNTVGDAFTAVQLTFSGWRSLAVAFPFLAFASFVLAGMLIGKSMCGWVCPFGFVQDLIDLVKRRKRDFSLRNHESMVYVKYLILGIALFIMEAFITAAETEMKMPKTGEAPRKSGNAYLLPWYRTIEDKRNWRKEIGDHLKLSKVTVFEHAGALELGRHFLQRRLEPGKSERARTVERTSTFFRTQRATTTLRAAAAMCMRSAA